MHSSMSEALTKVTSYILTKTMFCTHVQHNHTNAIYIKVLFETLTEKVNTRIQTIYMYGHESEMVLSRCDTELVF